LQLSRDSFNQIYDRCNDPARGKLNGKFLFDDFVTFMEEYRQKFRADQLNRLKPTDAQRSVREGGQYYHP
jgi:hypothetical protein